jgi:hypothetical protein
LPILNNVIDHLDIWLLILCQMKSCKVFLPFYKLSLHYSDCLFCCAESFRSYIKVFDIHLELILVQGEWQGSNFTFLPENIQFSHYHLLKRLSFLKCMIWSYHSLTYIWRDVSQDTIKTLHTHVYCDSIPNNQAMKPA